MTDLDLKEPKEHLKFYETWTFVIIVCIILPICFRAFVYSPRHIPSSSMKPTLLIGDYIFISKSSYGFGKMTFPFGYAIDYFEGRIFESQKPQRGDIIVFRPPVYPTIDYIKRLVGLPGDKVQVVNGRLQINGKELPIKRIEDFYDTSENGSYKSIKRYIETMPNGVSYQILDDIENSPGDNTKVFEVPAGHYFFMGDNRDNSADSRFDVSYVPEENLIGRADVLFFSNESSFVKIWQWIHSFREGRFWIKLKNETSD